MVGLSSEVQKRVPAKRYRAAGRKAERGERCLQRLGLRYLLSSTTIQFDLDDPERRKLPLTRPLYAFLSAICSSDRLLFFTDNLLLEALVNILLPA